MLASPQDIWRFISAIYLYHTTPSSRQIQIPRHFTSPPFTFFDMMKFTQQSDLMPFIASHTDSDLAPISMRRSRSIPPLLLIIRKNSSHYHILKLRSHSPSLSSSSGLSTPSFPPSEYSKSDYAMSYQGDDETQHFYYTPSTEPTYYPTVAPSTMSMGSYAYAEDFSNHEQPAWSTPSIYSQQQEFSVYPEILPSSVYQPSEVQPSLGSTNLIPPTPQSPMQAPVFDFNTDPQQSYLTPSMSHSRSRENSIHSFSRSTSPASNLSSSPSAASLRAYGTLVASISQNNAPQTWRCAYPGCTSRALFTRGCDLRKHYNRHSKHLFCRVDGCPQAEPKDGSSGSVGFSSKKDRARHEAKHNPGIPCEWRDADGEGCGRVFSRVDNMKDHVRRIHYKGNR